MCTLALYHRALAGVSLLVAANRDEHHDRPSAAPELREGTPKTIAGKDLRVGGTWMGVNEDGLFAGILNRRANGDVAPANSSRSRGLLCADLLTYPNAARAQEFIRSHCATYQPYTAVVADRHRAWAAHNANGGLSVTELTPGLHVFSSHAEVDLGSPKGDRASKQFAALCTEALPFDGWALSARLQLLLSDHSLPPDSEGAHGEAICVHGEVSGTVSASIVILRDAAGAFEFFHCPGPPCQNRFNARWELPLR